MLFLAAEEDVSLLSKTQSDQHVDGVETVQEHLRLSAERPRAWKFGFLLASSAALFMVLVFVV